MLIGYAAVYFTGGTKKTNKANPVYISMNILEIRSRCQTLHGIVTRILDIFVKSFIVLSNSPKMTFDTLPIDTFLNTGWNCQKIPNFAYSQ